jgi:hypothetical protein
MSAPAPTSSLLKTDSSFGTDEVSLVASIAGNMSAKHKLIVKKVGDTAKTGFAKSTTDRMRLTEVSVRPIPEEESRLEARLVCDVVVDEGANQT